VCVPLMLEKWFLLGTLASRPADESPESPANKRVAHDTMIMPETKTVQWEQLRLITVDGDEVGLPGDGPRHPDAGGADEAVGDAVEERVAEVQQAPLVHARHLVLERPRVQPARHRRLCSNCLVLTESSRALLYAETTSTERSRRRYP
jgi:hypothetical protein